MNLPNDDFCKIKTATSSPALYRTRCSDTSTISKSNRYRAEYKILACAEESELSHVGLVELACLSTMERTTYTVRTNDT